MIVETIGERTVGTDFSKPVWGFGRALQYVLYKSDLAEGANQV